MRPIAVALLAWCLQMAGWSAPPAAVGTAINAAVADAAQAGNREALMALIRQGRDVNAPQSDGTTPLDWAAHHNDFEMVELLLRAGAKVNTINDYGSTPLCEAA